MGDPFLFYADTYRSASLMHCSGFLAPDPFLFLERGAERILVASALEAGRARKESRATAVRELNEFGFEELVSSGFPAESAKAEVAARFLVGLGVGAVAVPRDFPVFLADFLRERGVVVRVATGLEARRRRKRDDEIAAIEEAQRAAEAAFDRAVAALRVAAVAADRTLVLAPLTAERLVSIIETTFLERGCRGDGTIAARGTQAADPHAVGTGTYRAGEAIVMDLFPQHRRTRYFSDMSRTVCRGEPPAEIVRMYGAVLGAQEAGIAAIRPGVTGRTVHEAVEDSLYDAGYATLREGQRRDGVARFIHGTGHGLGLAIHEEPSLGRAGNEPLEVGDVVTVEPGLYDPRIGGVRLEDVVVVTADGCHNLTRTEKKLAL